MLVKEAFHLAHFESLICLQFVWLNSTVVARDMQKRSNCLLHLDHFKLENREPLSKDTISGFGVSVAEKFSPKQSSFLNETIAD